MIAYNSLQIYAAEIPRRAKREKFKFIFITAFEPHNLRGIPHCNGKTLLARRMITQQLQFPYCTLKLYM
jgi:hypothetical protein